MEKHLEPDKKQHTPKVVPQNTESIIQKAKAPSTELKAGNQSKDTNIKKKVIKKKIIVRQRRNEAPKASPKPVAATPSPPTTEHKSQTSTTRPGQTTHTRRDTTPSSQKKPPQRPYSDTNTSASQKATKKVGEWHKPKNQRTRHFDYKTRKERELSHTYHKKSRTPVASIPSLIKAMETISIADLAKKMNIKASEIISKLISMGVMATINQVIDSETATLVASEYGCEIETISLYDEVKITPEQDKPEDLESRPPVVTIMGHVDHGKTSLLDVIRKSELAHKEAGNITQHIGAYQVHTERGAITFLDTPGHEAFTAIRARGAQVTDVVILVVAANDGIRPQTLEAINHTKAANVPIVVALNKIDLPDINIKRVKEELLKHELVSEEWGGHTQMIEISALHSLGINELLDAIFLEAEMLALKANPKRKATGVIIESKIDVGRGSVATVLIQQGTLKVGDYFVSGVYSGKVRALFNDMGEMVSEAGPSMPVEVLGLSGVPNAGDPFNVLDDEKQTKVIAQKRQDLERITQAKKVKKVTMENLTETLAEEKLKSLKIILKSDVQGSIEALKDSLEKFNNEEVTIQVIHSATGAINENDIILAKASNAIIIGFHVHPNGKAALLAQKEGVVVRRYSIIYDAIESVRALVEGMLDPELREEITGEAEIRELFTIPKVGVIAGSYVQSGKILKSNKIRIIRNGNEIHEGPIQSLKRFKEDVKEVKEGNEFGISLEKYNDLQIGDILESFIIRSTNKILA